MVPLSTSQLTLDSWLQAHPPRSVYSDAPGRRSLEEQFEAFHAANPQVFAALLRLARRARDAGATKIGAKLLVERLRWEFAVETRGDEFRLNNNHTSRYVRLLIVEDPTLAPLFETRELRAH